MATSKQVQDWLTGISKTGLMTNPVDEAKSLASTTLAMLDSDFDSMEGIEQLSPHFTLSELCHSDTADARQIDNSPDDAELDQLQLLANRTLEKIRDICKAKPVTVTSGFRCQELNAAIGGASNSAHLYGCGADIIVPTFGSPLDVCRAIQPHVKELEIDQLIYETNTSGGVWVHVGRVRDGTPRGQCFSIIKGVTQYTPFPG